jgi:hypothetical protein
MPVITARAEAVESPMSVVDSRAVLVDADGHMPTIGLKVTAHRFPVSGLMFFLSGHCMQAISSKRTPRWLSAWLRHGVHTKQARLSKPDLNCRPRYWLASRHASGQEDRKRCRSLQICACT